MKHKQINKNSEFSHEFLRISTVNLEFRDCLKYRHSLSHKDEISKESTSKEKKVRKGKTSLCRHDLINC
ncbi:CLUMA_CG018617, isoform A [Clunio marinus]|uniref:CLUMA_CG018617, isoform A n=1 Tax=Clunio marinus TaxID=568069 RepID=A0A1J1J1Z0_9DIPT|nr:CLUMA_CG018617, isoform A [Clunio marinus]